MALWPASSERLLVRLMMSSPGDMVHLGCFSKTVLCGYSLFHFYQILRCINNCKMDVEGLKNSSRSEILKYFGIFLLMTRFRCNGRRSLWITNTGSNYIISAIFESIISCQRFENLRKKCHICRRWRKQWQLGSCDRIFQGCQRAWML